MKTDFGIDLDGDGITDARDFRPSLPIDISALTAPLDFEPTDAGYTTVTVEECESLVKRCRLAAQKLREAKQKSTKVTAKVSYIGSLHLPTDFIFFP